MLFISRPLEGRSYLRVRKQRTLNTATLFLLLLPALSGFAQTAAKKPAKLAPKKEPEIKEELTLKNGDRLTGQLLNSTGTEIKFKSDLAGEVTVAWNNVKELKSKREFAVIPKDIKDSRNSALVPQGAIKIGEKDIEVSPIATGKSEVTPTPAKIEPEPTTAPKSSTSAAVVAEKEVPTSKIGFIVDDASYQKEIHRKIGWRSGWDGI